MILPMKKGFAAVMSIAAVFICVSLISCGSPKDLPPASEAAPPEEAAVSVADAELADSGFALAGGEGPDMILELYRNEVFRERVEDFFGGLAGSRELAQAVLANAALFDIPPALAFSLCWEESRYNPRAVNRKNRNLTVDRGLFQLNNASFPQLKEEQFFNPELNSRYGLSHLRWCLDTAGTEVAGLAMYNAGTGRVRSGGTPKMTLDYISRILDREREIEGFFLAEYERITRIEAEEETPLEKAGIRLSLLSPLGRR
jgi:predicted small lipoprotein YifL